MFTGLIEETGSILNIRPGSKSTSVSIKASKVLEDANVGDSIAVNGICLTVTSKSADNFTADVMPETIKRTNLHRLTKGSKVNLERALKLGDRLGGHMVSGHIDSTGEIIKITPDENAVLIEIGLSSSLIPYIIEKGSVSIDGISLTVASVTKSSFTVSVIPHTKKMTTLEKAMSGQMVNIECDMIGKYIHSFVANSHLISTNYKDYKETEPSKLDMGFLASNGFL